MNLPQKSINASNIFVKNCITQALISLLKQKNFEEISITELVNKAGVSRMGFYRNYKNKEEVVEKFVLDQISDTISQIKQNRKISEQINTIMTTTFTKFKKFKTEIMLLIKNNLEWLLLKSFENSFDLIYKKPNNSNFNVYYYKIFFGELYFIAITWIKQGATESPQELSNIYYKILNLRLKQEIL